MHVCTKLGLFKVILYSAEQSGTLHSSKPLRYLYRGRCRYPLDPVGHLRSLESNNKTTYTLVMNVDILWVSKFLKISWAIIYIGVYSNSRGVNQISRHGPITDLDLDAK